jgi:hypothetical protein
LFCGKRLVGSDMGCFFFWFVFGNNRSWQTPKNSEKNRHKTKNLENSEFLGKKMKMGNFSRIFRTHVIFVESKGKL